MSSRPQDPRTQKIRDDEEDQIATLRPRSRRPADDGVPATVFPDPDATALPVSLEPPKPKSQIVRGGAAAGPRTWAGLDDQPAPVVAAPQPKRAPSEAALRPQPKLQPPKRTSWGVWALAFLVLAGIGFGVAWFVINPQGGADVKVAQATPEAPADSAKQAEAAEKTADEPSPTPDPAEGAPVVPEPEVEADVQVAQAEVEADAPVVPEPEAKADALVAQAAVQEDAPVAPEPEVESDAPVVPEPEAEADVPVVPEPDAKADVQALQVAPEPVLPPKNPAEANRLNEAGLNARKAGDHARATSLYTEALRFNPDHVWARYNLACELALAGRSREAFAELTTLYKLGTADSRRALSAARKDSDFDSIRDSGQFFRLTNF